jgi:hypothetical protein
MGPALAHIAPLTRLAQLSRRRHCTRLGREAPALCPFSLRIILRLHHRPHHKQPARQPAEDGHQQNQGPNTKVKLSHKIRRSTVRLPHVAHSFSLTLLAG